MAKKRKEFSIDSFTGRTAEHYAVAKTFDNEFSLREFQIKYLNDYPSRKPGSILPTDYAWNNNQLARDEFPSFLEICKRAKYRFIGLEEGQERKLRNPNMNHALFINGVFEDVLEEIIKAQMLEGELTCILQPYSGRVIKFLEGNDFNQHSSIHFYLSTTTDLKHIGYIAEIIGWEDKRKLANNVKKLQQLNEQIGKYQPIQQEVYFYSDAEKTKECVNLIEVKNLRKLAIPFQVGNLIKVSNGKLYKPRTQAGGWSPVNEVSLELMEATTSVLEETAQSELAEQINESLGDSSEERRKRLEVANKKPEVIQVISKGFKRNPDVIAEILERAGGVCERCKSKAPFIRKKDKSPYLEVHHIITLAQDGEDTVQNSVAMCPNCHREAHFGI